MRPAIIALVVGVLAGYYIGFKDSFRGERSIGGRIGIMLGTVDPNEMRYERYRRAQMMRDSIRSKSGLDSVVP